MKTIKIRLFQNLKKKYQISFIPYPDIKRTFAFCVSLPLFLTRLLVNFSRAIINFPSVTLIRRVYVIYTDVLID